MSHVDKFLEIAQAEVGVAEADGNKVKFLIAYTHPLVSQAFRASALGLT